MLSILVVKPCHKTATRTNQPAKMIHAWRYLQTRSNRRQHSRVIKQSLLLCSNSIQSDNIKTCPRHSVRSKNNVKTKVNVNSNGLATKLLMLRATTGTKCNSLTKVETDDWNWRVYWHFCIGGIYQLCCQLCCINNCLFLQCCCVWKKKK